jgi:NADPH2 dehydrogenase
MSRLFQPLALGTTKLGHRVAMAPLTRYRMDDDWNATALSKGIVVKCVGNKVICLTDSF